MACGRCEKPKVNYRKGLWSPEEDQRLRDYILKHGHGCWSAVAAKAGLQRNGKSCRLRWINYLRTGLKRGTFSAEEEEAVINLHAMWGNKTRVCRLAALFLNTRYGDEPNLTWRWSRIAMHLPGRTDNEVKNYWNSYLKKKVAKFEESNSYASGTSKSKESDNQRAKMSQIREDVSKQILGSNFLEPLESSSVDSRPFARCSIDYDSCKGTLHSPLPKVLFAEWLSMDHATGQSLPNSDGGMNCQWDFNPNADVIKYGSSQVDDPSSSDFLRGFGDTSIYGEFQLQFEPGGQILGGACYDDLPMDETGGSFDTKHDVIY